MMEEATVDEISTFIYNNGLFDWKLAKVVKEFEPEHYILSVPTLKHDSLKSILFVAVNNGAYSFFHITKDQLQADTEVLLEQFGAGNLIIPIFSFFQYSQVLGSRRAFDFLYTHLTHPEVADEILEIIPRGWCLIEIELYTENQSHEDVDENCNCTYVNQLFPNAPPIMNPPAGVHPSEFDPYWSDLPIQQHKWRINYLNNDGTVIHGSPGESGTTVYHFWAWCEDEVGQDPWAHSWATNLEPTGGGGGPINTGPDWSYNKPRWNENTMECMFAFNHPHSTAMINQLEEALLTASCGEAAEYNVKSIIDNIVMGLCNEYYDNQEAQGGEFPQFPTSPPHDIHETLEAITLGVESSSYYQIGQQICEVCDNALNPGQCYDAVNNCGTEGYEACVEEALCGYSLQAFRAAYNLSLPLDDACTDHPEVVQFLLEHQESAQFSEEEINRFLENPELFQEISTFLGQHLIAGGSESDKNLAVAIARAYDDIYAEFGSTMLDLGDGPSDPMRDIVIEMLLETVKELVADLIPGGTLATIGPELFANLQGGQWMDAMFNAVDIVLNEADVFFPAAKVTSFAIGAYTTGKALKKAFEAFKEAKKLGEDFLLGLYNVFIEKLGWDAGDIRDRFKWKSNDYGAELLNVDPDDFKQEILDQFGEVIMPFLDWNGNPVYKIIDIDLAPNASVYLVYYTGSSSGAAHTFEFIVGPKNANTWNDIKDGNKFKIRI
jgi:hypothetical protein